MHLFGFSVFCLALFYANLAFESSHDYYEYDQDQADAMQEHSEPDLVEQLRSAGSVDELMRIVYPTYRIMLKCRSKMGSRLLRREPSSTETRSEEASFAAAFINLELLKSIEIEWRKTLCMPRQVCLDVGKEFGATNTFYKPPCVSVYRCGGCCNSEELQCRNISTSYISKTLFEITVPVKQGTKPVTISFANHTSCSCLSKQNLYRQQHSIIRRALTECHVANKTCPKNHSWSNHLCKCVLLPDTLHSKPHSDFETDFCGPDKELDEETCQCECRKELRKAGCGPHHYLDKNTCQCVCKAQPSSCGPQQSFNRDTCQCTCAKVCPRSQPLNRTKCVCECTESPNKCFLKGRRFHPATCSCVRPPCNVDPKRRKCKENEYFSEELCHCIPTYWGRLD
ncbi:vascular endothelial growth factor C precursor [Danio rerio]|uniref:Vascular endothelial growth factor C n=1 Tax=Danio rerio TaxID=7955 RepID=Q7T3I6_DANRE|nr:vascular endothelial growth factor C precursor [Danio rerio]AAI14254.1 Vascular endothelial growth factor c [Danio rerio]AAP44161.1 vascular endothelial growth factor C [Danio rerio]|eukprot:NP_991297.1 vascular endothelial growth factor C precursor [Danio rerio]